MIPGRDVARELVCAGKRLELERPQVMGILNITPDSFSDGGVFFSADKAVERALAMVDEGAAILDIGGESTRPGAQPVSVQEELDRVIPVVSALASEIDIPISVDTSKPEVMRAAIGAGAGIINDVNALRSEGALEAAASLGVPVVLMHMKGDPRTMQQDPRYQDVLAEVKDYLLNRVSACEMAGIARERIIIDPGFGFGKRLEHNMALLRHLDELVALGFPVLVGVSRKSMIGAILGEPDAGQRLFGGIALATLAAWWGAAIIRTHDVKATQDALRICQALQAAR